MDGRARENSSPSPPFHEMDEVMGVRVRSMSWPLPQDGPFGAPDGGKARMGCIGAVGVLRFSIGGE